jgi:hypothetical protein
MKQGPVESCTLFAESNSINTTNSTNPINKPEGFKGGRQLTSNEMRGVVDG